MLILKHFILLLTKLRNVRYLPNELVFGKVMKRKIIMYLMRSNLHTIYPDHLSQYRLCKTHHEFPRSQPNNELMRINVLKRPTAILT